MSCCDNNTPTPPTPTPPPQPVAPCPCSVSITPGTLSLCNTATGTLTANGTPAGGTFSWTSSNTSAATVSASGATTTVTNVVAGNSTVTVTYSPPGCPPCTATATVTTCKCTPKPGGGRYYSNAKKSEASLVGISAKIKTRYGKVCCEGCATVTGYAVVYVNITRNPSGDQKWAQTGYGRERNPGSSAINKYRYAEMNGSTYKVKYDTDNPPAEGSFHTYACELDKTTGTWSYSEDGSAWRNFQDDFWKNKVGDFFQYTGEIFNKEDDMPGTAADKCTFTECKIKKDGAAAYVDAGLAAGNMGNHDAAEWGEEFVSSTAINIWDKKPLP